MLGEFEMTNNFMTSLKQFHATILYRILSMYVHIMYNETSSHMYNYVYPYKSSTFPLDDNSE